MRTRRRLIAPALLLVLAATPAPARAQQTGGAEAGERPGFASASDGTVSVSTRPGGLVGRPKTFRGSVPPADAGRSVTVERFDDLAGQWSPIAHATAEGDGAFAARWKPDRAGPARVRVRVEGAEATAASAAPELAITLYRGARATFYGPGLYGRRTACGQKLTRGLLGVAHRKLPCGTQVAFLHRGRTLTVPVLDRGPFANGARWDLTAAAARELGFEATGRVGALRLQDDSR